MSHRSTRPSAVDRAAARRFTDIVLDEITAGTFTRRPSLVVDFSPCLGNDERIVCSAPFTRRWFGSIHAGGHGVVLAGGTGSIGALVIARTGAAAMRRRRRVAHDAAPAWHDLDAGQIHVSTHGFYLQTAAGLPSFGWDAVMEAEPTSSGVVGLGCEMSHGIYERFLISTVYAELIVALWANVRSPTHRARRWQRPEQTPSALS